MRQKQWIVCIDWQDGTVEDTDEISVSAYSSDEAITAAKRKWRLTIGADYPSCRIRKAFVLSESVIKKFSY